MSDFLERLEVIVAVVVGVTLLVLFIFGVVLVVVTCRELLFPMLRELRAKRRADAARSGEREVEE